ncbi:recombinase family protein (plasmid) [Moritella sp. 24]|uniref:recombinase family protein n=1 Tax=Moritella sp. 24 TaxID=2746230 RepID=UPI001BA65651|nr:recombinase family protein [Moritella sp. 24]QUM78788.1 recombinase family protein [Moritella sp. 24]
MTFTAYIRVSDANKADGESQRAAIQSYAVKNGLAITKWVEEHISATKTDIQDRQLMSSINNQEKIIVTDITRLGRNKVMALIGIIGSIKELHLAYDDRVINDDNRDNAETIFCVVGQSFASAVESKKRSERAVAGHARRKAAGLQIGRAPGAIIKSKLDIHSALILNELSKGTAKTKIVDIIKATGTTCTRQGLYEWISKRTIT